MAGGFVRISSTIPGASAPAAAGIADTVTSTAFRDGLAGAATGTGAIAGISPAAGCGSGAAATFGQDPAQPAAARARARRGGPRAGSGSKPIEWREPAARAWRCIDLAATGSNGRGKPATGPVHRQRRHLAARTCRPTPRGTDAGTGIAFRCAEAGTGSSRQPWPCIGGAWIRRR